MNLKKIRFWVIRKMGGRLPEVAEQKHRYSIETQFGRYYADKFKLHNNGAVEWWSKDSAWGDLHRLEFGGGIEITDNGEDGRR